MIKTANLFDSLLEKTINLSSLLVYLPITAITAMITALKLLIERYVFSDWNFLIFLLIAVGADTLLGVYKSIKLKNFKLKALSGGVFEKLFLYMIYLVITHVVVHFTINSEVNGLFGWLDDAMYSFLIVVELLSIFESAYKIKPQVVPTKIRTYFQDFNEKGELKTE